MNALNGGFDADSKTQAHSAKSKQDMTAREYFSAPRPVEEIVVKQNKSAIGKAFKAKAKDVQAVLDALTSCEEDALRLKVWCIFLQQGTHIFSARMTPANLKTISRQVSSLGDLALQGPA